MDLTDTEAQQVWPIYDRPLWVAGWNPQDADAVTLSLRSGGPAIGPHSPRI